MTDKQKLITLISLVFIGSVLYLLNPILPPFLIAFTLAYLGDPIVDRLEALGMNRSLSVAVFFFIIISFLLLILLVLIPTLLYQIKMFISILPRLGEWLQTTLIPKIITYTHLDPGVLDFHYIIKKMTAQWKNTSYLISYISQTLSSSGLVVIAIAVNTFLIPIVTFYLLRDWDILTYNIQLLLPEKIKKTATKLTKECDEVLAAFIKGQLIVMLCLGLFYGIGLWFIGLNFALLIGLIAGLISIIPYMGFTIGFVTALLVAFFQFDNYTILISVTTVFIIGQILESYLLTPWLIGDRIGLHPVLVIFSLMAGGQILGITGMLIALPVAAIIMVMLRHAHTNYKNSDFYRTK